MAETKPLIIAHRGASEIAPENSLPAFTEALRMGADMLETDVHWTKDGVIVVSHDADVDRLSNGSGPIRSFTFEALKKLDFGYGFTQDNGETFPYRNCGITILSLNELLQQFPQTRFNIDIKPENPPSLQAYIETLYRSDAQNRVITASFNDDVLKQLRQMNRHLHTSASRREIAQAIVQSWLPIRAPLPYVAAQVPPKSGMLTVVTRRFVCALHRRGAAVHVWTIDDESEMRRLLALGVDGIVTNRPDRGITVRDEFVLKKRAEDPKV